MILNSVKQIIFEKGCSLLKVGDFVGFAEAITEIYTSHSLCKCFFAEQPTDIWPSLLSEVMKLEVENQYFDFDINFSKGFIFLHNANHDEAFYYLTRAISINPLSNVAYNIRSSVSAKYNKGCLQDATEALLLWPSSTNYFTLGNLVRECEKLFVGGCLIETKLEEVYVENINIEKASLLYGQAIRLDEKFICAYNNKAEAHQHLREFDAAKDLYMKCIEIDPKRQYWAGLWCCLNRNEATYESMVTALENLVSSSPNRYELYFELAFAYERRGDYRKAVESNALYLNNCPNDKWNASRSAWLNEKLSYNMDSNAVSLAKSGCYSDAVFCFNTYLQSHSFRKLYSVDFYLKNLIKSVGINIDNIEKNTTYKELINLRENFSKKIELGIEPSEKEESASKIKIYYSKNKIHFGEYYDWVINDIIEKNANYILWCIVNLEHFSLWNKDIVDKRFFQEDLYIKAVEINLIKNSIVGRWAFALEEEEEADVNYYRNYKWEEETFDALTDGQLGDWNDFNGNIDDARTSMGLD